MSERRQPTSTSTFGVGRRENHDSTAFYDRFPPPVLAGGDRTVVHAEGFDRPRCIAGDARKMVEVPDSSVALVVTSPPYFAGKEYEQRLGEEGVPASYVEYLAMLHDVLAECVRTLEAGGRIAVNVANLGRKPYRSLSADVIGILQDDLGLLLRGEVIWQKAQGASNSLAWGSYRSPANPVLRDLTERVIVASKGRFDRAFGVEERAGRGLPSEIDTTTLTADEYMEATLDVWHIPSESARRVRHPAPFPVALPARLINLYTYRDDLVLDPFMGSGSTLVAAVEHGRRAVGYDLDEGYRDIAARRVEEASRAVEEAAVAPGSSTTTGPVAGSGIGTGPPPRIPFQGDPVRRHAGEVLRWAGFDIVDERHRLARLGVEIDLVVRGRGDQRTWFVDVSGAFTVPARGGLRRADMLWKTIGGAGLLRNDAGRPGSEVPVEHPGDTDRSMVRLLLLTSHLPERGEGLKALHAAGPRTLWDVIEMRSGEDLDRLAVYGAGGCVSPLPGFWADSELPGPS